jgi:hypothetical protein
MAKKKVGSKPRLRFSKGLWRVWAATDVNPDLARRAIEWCCRMNGTGATYVF